MKIRANGVELFYERSGDGPPLILLHGNGEDHRIFDAIAPKLAAAFTVYAVDSRNHGQSQRTDAYSYRVMMDDVHAFIRTLGLAGVALVGFSDGAIISLLLAMHHGETVGRMALLGVNLTPDDFTEECRREIAETYEKTGDPLYRLMLEEPDITLDDVRHVAVPTLLVAGEHDIYKPGATAALAAALPNAALAIMPGHDHASYVIGQDILFPDLMRFFRPGTGPT